MFEEHYITSKSVYLEDSEESQGKCRKVRGNAGIHISGQITKKKTLKKIFLAREKSFNFNGICHSIHVLHRVENKP